MRGDAGKKILCGINIYYTRYYISINIYSYSIYIRTVENPKIFQSIKTHLTHKTQRQQQQQQQPWITTKIARHPQFFQNIFRLNTTTSTAVPSTFSIVSSHFPVLYPSRTRSARRTSMRFTAPCMSERRSGSVGDEKPPLAPLSPTSAMADIN